MSPSTYMFVEWGYIIIANGFQQFLTKENPLGRFLVGILGQAFLFQVFGRHLESSLWGAQAEMMKAKKEMIEMQPKHSAFQPLCQWMGACEHMCTVCTQTRNANELFGFK